MSLFGFGRKKEDEENKGCCCGGDSSQTENCCCNNELTSIKVLGAGCKSCHDQYQNVIDAVAELGIATDVQYITDMEVVMGYGVMSMPAIVVNEKVAAYGKVLNSAEVIKLLGKLGF